MLKFNTIPDLDTNYSKNEPSVPPPAYIYNNDPRMVTYAHNDDTFIEKCEIHHQIDFESLEKLNSEKSQKKKLKIIFGALLLATMVTLIVFVIIKPRNGRHRIIHDTMQYYKNLI